MLDPKASPELRADYEQRAGIAAAYREAAGITEPDKDIAPDPHEGNPELETWRQAAMKALEIRPPATPPVQARPLRPAPVPPRSPAGIHWC